MTESDSSEESDILWLVGYFSKHTARFSRLADVLLVSTLLLAFLPSLSELVDDALGGWFEDETPLEIAVQLVEDYGFAEILTLILPPMFLVLTRRKVFGVSQTRMFRLRQSLKWVGVVLLVPLTLALSEVLLNWDDWSASLTDLLLPSGPLWYLLILATVVPIAWRLLSHFPLSNLGKWIVRFDLLICLPVIAAFVAMLIEFLAVMLNQVTRHALLVQMDGGPIPIVDNGLGVMLVAGSTALLAAIVFGVIGFARLGAFAAWKRLNAAVLCLSSVCLLACIASAIACIGIQDEAWLLFLSLGTTPAISVLWCLPSALSRSSGL